jgi:transcriptional regulator with XRE-family HTH domain
VSARPRSSEPEGDDARASMPIERRSAALGVRLLGLRRAAGLTQKALADRLGVRQPTVSRFEAGRDIPTPEMLGRLGEALGFSDEIRAELEDRIGELRVEVRTARLLVRQGARAVQLQVGEREARATSVWSYHLALVPGLLQTPEYTRAMAAVVDPDTDVDVEALVAGRQERQRLLLDPTRRFRFLLTEAALRARVAPLPVLRAQLRRLGAVVEGFDHVDVGVISSATPLSSWTLTGFDVIGDAVEIEYLTGSVAVRDPRDVDVYRRQFDRLDAQAVHGGAVAALLRDLDRWLSRLPE